ncbi:hypothetical protein HJC23_002043 [Cyclotella cryptica]|uniref:HSF-type DNA-binding domain-containing protein n=1 Tax=Cyclotella cryptica TaxID=29204 RepID=A0ABD3Q7V3_9STRA|eukprot:CCRYP_008275-RA/>CCRYP_008275-RA protein AED:0.22 eAED:0.22 QI:921/1/1/1/1/1/2/216/605
MLKEEVLPSSLSDNGSSKGPCDAVTNNSDNSNAASIQRPLQHGIVSSENSVASNSATFPKHHAAALAASVAADHSAPAPGSNIAPAIHRVSEPYESRRSPPTVSENCTPTEEEKKENDGNDSVNNNANGSPCPLSSDANNALLLHMAAPPHHPVAEFLFQLTKMLTDDNSEYIEWKNSSILVHDPPGLEKRILPKYFRHSNYSSFQRQMNYFGFRKIAGKGKMAACSYVNEHAKEDISSLLYIKRKKTSLSGSAAKLLAQANKLNIQQDAISASGAFGAMNTMMMMNGMNPNTVMMNGMAANTTGGGMMGINANQLALLQQQQLMLQQNQNQNSLLGGMGGGGMGLNGLQGMNGLQGTNGIQGIGINGIPNMYASKLGPSAGASVNKPAFMRDQQQIMAQLQHAHAYASGGLPGTSMGNNVSSQSFMNNFGNVFPSSANSAAILTNDQGNLYSAASAPSSEWKMSNCGGNATNPQALLLQQAAAAATGFGGLPQGGNGLGQGMGENPDDMRRINSAANLRSFINQQISLFSENGSQAPGAPNGGASMNMASTGRSLGLSPSMAGMSESMPSNLPQGLSYEQLLQLNGMANGACAGGDSQQFFHKI